ncbi:MAG: hypothetical protein ABI333_00545 [bacterium]
MRIWQTALILIGMLGLVSTAKANTALPIKVCVWETDGDYWQCSTDISYDGYSFPYYLYTVNLCAASPSDDGFYVEYKDYEDTATSPVSMYDENGTNQWDRKTDTADGIIDYTEIDGGSVPVDWSYMDVIAIRGWYTGVATYRTKLRWECT